MNLQPWRPDDALLTTQLRDGSVLTLRPATPDDAADIQRIYAPVVAETAISFETEPPSVEEMRRRIAHTLETYPYIVAEVVSDGRRAFAGYSYASRFHERAAYAHCVETTIYVAPAHHGRGVGRLLYTQLERCLRPMGVRNLYACIAWTDNPGPRLTNQSTDFHAHMGYTRCGLFRRSGWKFGEWFDMIWMEKLLPAPEEVKSL